MDVKEENLVFDSLLESQGNRPNGQIKRRIKTSIMLWQEEQMRELFEQMRLTQSGDTHIETCHDENLIRGENSNSERFCDKMSCGTCQLTFEERHEQIRHFKSDWHQFNIKRRMRDQQCVSETIFQTMSSEGDLSNISSSDCSSDESQISVKVPNNPRVFLRSADGDVYSLYRCLINSGEVSTEGETNLLNKVQELCNSLKWTIIMLAGGHFAAAVFDKDDVIVHKCFHRYVVRAKRGTMQSSYDKKGGAPKSGGASLRRYNEAALSKEIEEILLSWKEHLSCSDKIFLRIPFYRRTLFYGGKSPVFQRHDPRIQSIPFQTKRPTFREVKRVHALLAAVECHGKSISCVDYPGEEFHGEDMLNIDCYGDDMTDNEEVNSALPGKHKSEKLADLQSNSEYVRGQDLSDLSPTELSIHVCDIAQVKAADVETVEQDEIGSLMLFEETITELNTLKNNLFTACKTGDVCGLKEILECNIKKLNDGFEDQHTDTSVTKATSLKLADVLNQPFGHQGTTLLHVAAQLGHNDIIKLLLQYGSDRCLRDRQGKLPCDVCPSRSTSKVFRTFIAQQPELNDYATAQNSGSVEIGTEKKSVKAGKSSRKKKRDRHKKARDEEKEILSSAIPSTKFIELRCDECAADLTGKIPFEYKDYKFCSMKCLKNHRLTNMPSAR